MRLGLLFLFSRSIQLVRFVEDSFVSERSDHSKTRRAFQSIVSIYVPLDGDPGGHYGGIIFSSTPPEEKGGNGRCRRTTRGYNAFCRFPATLWAGKNRRVWVLRRQAYFTHLPVNFSCASRTRGRSTSNLSEMLFITNMIGGLDPASIKVKPLG